MITPKNTAAPLLPATPEEVERVPAQVEATSAWAATPSPLSCRAVTAPVEGLRRWAAGRWAWGFLAALGILGCGDGPQAEDEPPPQEDDAEVCVVAGCACEQDLDCAQGLGCLDGVCTEGWVSAEAPAQPEPPEVPRATPPEVCPGGVFHDTGVCQPTPPSLADPQGCPGAAREDGLCMPLPPDFSDCPEGWRIREILTASESRRLRDDLHPAPVICAPPPPGEGCEAGTMPVVGSPECEPMGLACPEGEPWHDEATLRSRAPGFDGAIRHVLPGALNDPLEADGSRARPFATVADALGRSSDGDLIALGVGSQEEAIVLDRRVALLGSCVAGTSLTIAAVEGRETPPTVSVTAPALLSDLRLTGDGVGLTIARADGATLRDLLVEDSVGVGVLIEGGARVEADGLYLRALRADVLTPDRQAGLLLQEEAQLRASRVSVEGAHLNGVRAHSQGVVLELEALYVRGTHPVEGNAVSGVGVQLFQGARASLRRVLLDDNVASGLRVIETDLEMTDFRIQNTRSNANGELGMGMSIRTQAEATLSRGSLGSNQEIGVACSDAALTLQDVVVHHTRPHTIRGVIGRGITVGTQGRLTLRRVSVVKNNDVGVMAFTDSGRLEMEDVGIFMTQVPALNSFGAGLMGVLEGRITGRRVAIASHIGNSILLDGATAELQDLQITRSVLQPFNHVYSAGIRLKERARIRLERALLQENAWLAMQIEDSAVEASDLILRDQVGIGINRGELTFSRALLEDHFALGVQASGASELTLTDVTITGTRFSPANATLSVALDISGGATLHGTRVAIRDNGLSGLVIAGTKSNALLTDLTVAHNGTRPQQEVDFWGVGVFLHARLTLQRAVIEDNATVGVIVQEVGATAHLEDTTLQGNRPDARRPEGGMGLLLNAGATATLTRARLNANHSWGILALGGGTRDPTLILTDVAINDTRPSPFSDLLGRGLHLQDGALAQFQRLSLRGNHEAALLMLNPSTTLDGTDLDIRDTRPTLLPDGSERGGTGLAIIDQAIAALTRFRVAGNRLIGIQLSRDGSLEGTDGTITDNFIGLNVQREDFDFDASFQRVAIYDNCCGDCGVQVCNVESDELPLPSAVEDLERFFP